MINNNNNIFSIFTESSRSNVNNTLSKYINNHLEDINRQDIYGDSLLMRAIEEGKIKLAKLFISKEANVNICNNNNQNGLMFACTRGYYDIVKLLVENNADLSLVDNNGDNALMYAIKGDLLNSLKIITYLISSGIEIYIKNNNTPLILAIKTNNRKFNDFINIYLNSDNKNVNTYINIQNNDGETALIVSVKVGDFHLVRKLCKKGANINITDNENNNLIIISAIHNDNSNILQYLIEEKKQKNNTNFFNYINHINNKGDNAFLSLLLNNEYKNRINILNILIDNGIDIHHTNKDGNNALMYSVRIKENLDIIRLLIKNGIDINHKNKDGNNALIYAIPSIAYIRDGVENLDIIRLLIDSGININNTNKDGNNALIYAINNDQISIVKIFLENKNLNINIVNNDNNSIINYFQSNELFNIIKDYVNQKNNNKKICKYIIDFINSYYITPKKHRKTISPKTSSSKLVRQQSLNAQKQDGGTCFAHAVSRCILRLIKNYIPNYFTNKNKENYIKINSFKNFKSYLNNLNNSNKKDKLDAMYYNNILYYYFYYIITNEFGCNGGDPANVLSYIINTYLNNNYKSNNNLKKNNLNIMNKEHIDNISKILNEFINLTKDINFNIKRYPYIQQYIPNEIKKILDKDLYVIFSFFGNDNFFNHFLTIKSSTIEYTHFNSYNNNKKYDGHSVVIKSYEKNSMIITNSWGKKWGFLGYLKLDENIFLNKSCLLPYFLYVDINKKKILKNNINKLPLQNLSLLYNNINKNKYFINLNDNNCDKSINKKKEKDKKYILDKMASIIENNKK
jgi:ankyrin repeat protein